MRSCVTNLGTIPLQKIRRSPVWLRRGGRQCRVVISWLRRLHLAGNLQQGHGASRSWKNSVRIGYSRPLGISRHLGLRQAAAEGVWARELAPGALVLAGVRLEHVARD